MNKLISAIQSAVAIPYIEEQDPVIDGCFAITPFITTSLKGNGAVQEISDGLALDIFYKRKADCVSQTREIYKALSTVSNYVVEEPEYTYQQEARMYSSSIRVYIIGGIS